MKPAVKNALNLNVKGPNTKWVCFPRFYSRLASLCLGDLNSEKALVILRMLYVNLISFLWSLLSDIDWRDLHACYVYLCKLNSIKAHWERGLRPFSSERLASLSSPSRSCLDRFILNLGGQESSAGQNSPTVIDQHPSCLTLKSINVLVLMVSGFWVTEYVRDTKASPFLRDEGLLCQVTLVNFLIISLQSRTLSPFLPFLPSFLPSFGSGLHHDLKSLPISLSLFTGIFPNLCLTLCLWHCDIISVCLILFDDFFSERSGSILGML